MPAAVNAQTEWGDAIQVILVECQGASEEDMLAFAMKQKWLGNGAIWTTERPFSTANGGGLPSYALLGPSGEVLMTGNSAADHSRIEEKIAELVKKGSSAPATAPAAAAKLYRDLDRGQFAKAALEAQKGAAKAAAKDAPLAAALNEVEKAAGERLAREIARVQALAAQGRYGAAQARADALAQGVKGHADFEAKAAELASLFEGPEVQREAAAERELDRLLADAFAEGAKDDKGAKKLRKFAEANAGTKAGERAARMAEIAGRAVALRG